MPAAARRGELREAHARGAAPGALAVLARGLGATPEQVGLAAGAELDPEVDEAAALAAVVDA